MKNNYQIMLKEMQFFSYIGGNNDRSMILDLMEASLNIALKKEKRSR